MLSQTKPMSSPMSLRVRPKSVGPSKRRGPRERARRVVGETIASQFPVALDECKQAVLQPAGMRASGSALAARYLCPVVRHGSGFVDQSERCRALDGGATTGDAELPVDGDRLCLDRVARDK